MKKIKWSILLVIFTLSTLACATVLAAPAANDPLFTFNVPVNFVNIPGTLGPVTISVALFDRNNVWLAGKGRITAEMNVKTGLINYNNTVTITFSAGELNGHRPEEVKSYMLSVGAGDAKSLADLMAQNGPNPYDATKPFNLEYTRLPIY